MVAMVKMSRNYMDLVVAPVVAAAVSPEVMVDFTVVAVVVVAKAVRAELELRESSSSFIAENFKL
jgi:hypothetical protein